MTGSPGTGRGELSERNAGPRSERYPWQLGVAVLAWIVLGAVLVISALTLPSTTSGADEASIDYIQSTLGSSAVAAGSAPGRPGLWLTLGLVVLLAAFFLLIGQGWARHLLAVLGVFAVIVFALSGRWETIIAFVALVMGTVPLLAPSAHRYLRGR